MRLRVTIFVGTILISLCGCGSSEDAAPAPNPVAAANAIVKNAGDKAELGARVAELRNGYQTLRASCEGEEDGCGRVNALQPMMAACSRMDEEACNQLESAMNELK